MRIPALLPGDPVTVAMPCPGARVTVTVAGSCKPVSLASTSMETGVAGPVTALSGLANAPTMTRTVAVFARAPSSTV